MAKMYTTQTISGYNASPPSDDGAQTTANEITWAKHKTKLGDPLKTLAEAINTALVSAIGTDLDLDGDMRLILDADADTIIDAAAVDDRIDIQIAGTDSVVIGHAAGNTGAFFHIDPGALTSTANTDFSLLRIGNTNAVIVPSGTTAIASGVAIEIPNWTATGTITNSAALYVEGAATEGTNDYAVWVDAGTSRFDGNILAGADSSIDIGETTVRFANVYTDAIGDTGQSLEVKSSDLKISGGVLLIAEQAEADADQAGFGQIWTNTATPNEAWFTDDTGVDYRLSTTEAFIVAASDETSAIAAGIDKVTFRMPYAFELLAGADGVKAALNSGASTGTFTVDIHESGTTILSTKLTIDATETTSATAAVAAVISDTTLAENAEISIDVDDAGAGDATGLKVTLIGRRVTG